jgi:hypothetical protein
MIIFSLIMRLLAFWLVIFGAASVLAQEELPTDPNEPIDIEPPLLIQEVPNRGPLESTSGPAPVNQLDPDVIQITLEKAKKNAASGERLFRSGVIAKVDAENRVLKVIRLEADLANARLEVAKQNVASQQGRFDAAEIPASELESAKSTLAAAMNEVALATAQREKAELEAALLNLRRQKKLLAVGSGRKSEVSRAEEKVTALQQQKN